jgi:YegS/Rv2252/BmrU family lipid kinase
LSFWYRVAVKIIVNPAAAGGRLGREWSRRSPVLRELGLDGEVVFTERPWHAIELAERAVRDGHQRVVAVGGDGTVNQTASGLCRVGGGTLCIVPLGTGNDAARTLGVPLGWREAAAAALDGSVREVDMIRLGDHLVLNAIGVGLLGDISSRATRIKIVRGLVAYLATALVSLVRFESPEVVLRTPDHHYEGAMTVLAVHGGPTSGGGFTLAPRAVPDDGLLDATLVPGIGPLGRVPRLLAAMKGTLGEMEGTVELQAPWLELEFDRPLPMHVDGDEAVLEPPLARFEVVPKALRVAVPKGQ